MTITLRSDFDVDLIEIAGSDDMIVRAARVSTGNDSIDNPVTARETMGLVNFLMKNRHGSPFEHGMMTFRITAPIFVWREFMRHRIGFSYNEQSGRYMELSPEFYIPPQHRPIVQTGKPGHYVFESGNKRQDQSVVGGLGFAYDKAWESYQMMLDRGVAKEVARMALPVGIYSSAYVTCNPRSFMSFLSLRTKDETSKFPSYPQWEIEQVARQMEAHFQNLYPITHNAFNVNGRVSP